LYSGHNMAIDEPVKSEKHTPPVNGERHCRGALRTDADGIAEFRSIYPGYYVERAIHIHFKVHIGERAFLTNQACCRRRTTPPCRPWRPTAGRARARASATPRRRTGACRP
jgi:hypothetical protein